MFQMLKKVFTEFASRIFPSELDTLDRAQVQALARDVGVSVDDLYRLEARAPGSAALLPVRLAREGIAPTVLQAKWPTVWKDLQRVCSLCDSKEICRHDLAADAAGVGWQQYCPNADTIESARRAYAPTRQEAA